MFITLGVVLFPFLAKDGTSTFGIQNVFFPLAAVAMMLAMGSRQKSTQHLDGWGCTFLSALLQDR